MEALKSWAIVVTGTVIFGSVCEMLMPDGNLRKFVRVALGILLVFAIAKPLINISDKDFMLNEIKQSQAMASDYSKGLDEENKFQIIKTYKKNLNKKMEEAIAERDPDIVVDINSEVETQNEKNFGNIKHISAIVTNPGEGNSQETIYSVLNGFGVKKKNVDIKYIRQRGGE